MVIDYVVSFKLTESRSDRNVLNLKMRYHFWNVLEFRSYKIELASNVSRLVVVNVEFDLI